MTSVWSGCRFGAPIDASVDIVDTARFLGAIKLGTLTHERMESDDARIRPYGDCAVVTALTRTKAKFAGQEFTTQERAMVFL
jgi:uncharacterized protein DUF4440